MNNHNHCFHDAYSTRQVNGATRQLEACCWCGTPREMHLRMVTVKHGGHGPYVPVKDDPVPAGFAVNGG